jgi:hypothetical protein
MSNRKIKNAFQTRGRRLASERAAASSPPAGAGGRESLSRKVKRQVNYYEALSDSAEEPGNTNEQEIEIMVDPVDPSVGDSHVVEPARVQRKHVMEPTSRPSSTEDVGNLLSMEPAPVHVERGERSGVPLDPLSPPFHVENGDDPWGVPLYDSSEFEFEPSIHDQFVPSTSGTSVGGASGDHLLDHDAELPNVSGSRRTATYADGGGNRKFGSTMPDAAARDMVNKARREKLGVVFDPQHSKGGRNATTNMSKERYNVYKDLTTMEEIERAEQTPIQYSWESEPTDTVMRRGTNQFGKGGDDLRFDIQKGVALVQDGHGGYLKASLMAAQTPYRQAVQQLVACGAIELVAPGAVEAHEQSFIDEAHKWLEQSGIDADRGGAVEMPAWLAMAAKANTEVIVDGMTEPVTIMEAMNLPESHLWMAAIEKEVQGLIANGTWEEVDEMDVARLGRKVLPSRFVLKIKVKEVGGVMVLDKVKARLTAGGDRTRPGFDHFETAAFTASPTAVRTLIALAAASDDELVSYDISQAYLFSKVPPGQEIYMQLPELRGAGGVNAPHLYKGCGSGKGTGKVAKLAKMLYGLPEAGRRWGEHVMKFFESLKNDGLSRVRSIVSDRMAYVWKWVDPVTGKEEVLRACLHVDDFLVSVSSPTIKAEFEKRLAAYFGEGRATGGEAVSYHLGMRIERDRAKKTIKISQGGFVRKLLEKFGVQEGVKVKGTPLQGGVRMARAPTGSEPVNQNEYLQLVGSLQWLSISSRPDVTFAAGMLGRYSQCPTDDHWKQAMWCLHYLAGTADLGITYHGSDEVLMDGYDHRNKLIAGVDSDLGGCKDTQKSTSGVVVMLNGGAVWWKSRRQTTLSTATLEAECKAAVIAGMQLHWMRDLLGEFGHRQGCIRVLEDNSGLVHVAHGQKDSAKTAHFRRAVTFVEEKCHRGIMWLDDTPSEENWSDMFTKSIESAVLFKKLNDIVMGVTPTLYISPGAALMIRTGVGANTSELLRNARLLMENDES